MKENFQILKGLPPYGEMYISFPPKGYAEYSEGLVVEFLKNDESKWVGNFETGYSNLKFAAQLHDDEILIIAKGVCYIIDSENPKSFIEFGVDYKQVYQHNTSIIIVGEYSIAVVKSRTEIIYFDNLCYDGISETKLVDNNLNGILNYYNSNGDNEEIEFILDLDNLELRRIEKNTKWWEIWK
ncbi:hypothetical protein [Flavobacterium sp.]|uniref:hypothetical protein n=1 Tax=Flavobacterium sp. TaxID=239 RepID=UPI0011FEBF7C|nr:hypothetical protein [Flavobacterium sp.]RZJ70417.1 MAG: hypothetical protein EOO49_14145 [Flavobacterium sp.]